MEKIEKIGKYKLSEQTQIEAQIGFYIGIIIGMLASWVMIMFFTEWEWYFKLFSCIGYIGILGMLGLGLAQAIKTRRHFLLAKVEMEKMVQDLEPDKEVMKTAISNKVMQDNNNFSEVKEDE
jgi:uncharacterized protein YacL